MRWNKVITLLSPVDKFQDESGAWHEGERKGRVVFCNEYTIGLVAQAHLRSSDVRAANTTDPVDVGLRNEHMIQVRSIDYHNEDQCIFEGVEHEILYVSGSGETKILTISEKLSKSPVGDSDV